MWELWDYGERVGVYTDEKLAFADRDWLREDAYMSFANNRKDPEAARNTVDYWIKVKELVPRTKAQYAGKPHYALRD